MVTYGDDFALVAFIHILNVYGYVFEIIARICVSLEHQDISSTEFPE